ncbi:hypothetical protein J5X84_05900 [Streptosporangiaceae bacterium NEAU-GS5]|nr:hypothetical protein [Streptosporangiaceae bacterium NEAU-GS5]
MTRGRWPAPHAAQVPDDGVPDSFELRGQGFGGLDALPRAEAERHYADLMRYARACGCGAGAIGAALAGGLYLVGLPPMPAIAAALVGGVAGKSLGLWWAGRRFAAAARSLETALNGRSER